MDWIEIFAVLASLVFLILLIKQNIWCWIFGIVSSILSAYLFFTLKLYSESLLYVFYTLFGVYGWVVWARVKDELSTPILPPTTKQALLSLVAGIPTALLIGYLAKRFSDAAIPYIDAFTSVLGLVATYLEAHRYLIAWFFWIVLNAASSLIYYSRGLSIYAVLMLAYFGMSIYGYFKWKKLLVQ